MLKTSANSDLRYEKAINATKALFDATPEELRDTETLRSASKSHHWVPLLIIQTKR